MSVKFTYRVFIYLLFILYATIWFEDSSQATIVKRMNEEELIKSSTHIIMGTLVRSRSYWSQDHRFILTDVSVAVEKRIKGVCSDLITLQMMGGKVGDTTCTVVGGPLIPVSERVVLFLRKDTERTIDGSEQYFIVGLAQGMFIVRDDPKGRPSKLVSSAVDCKMELIPDDEGKYQPIGGKEGITLESLLQNVRHLDKKGGLK